MKPASTRAQGDGAVLTVGACGAVSADPAPDKVTPVLDEAPTDVALTGALGAVVVGALAVAVTFVVTGATGVGTVEW